MSHQLQTFVFDPAGTAIAVRVVMRGDEPWFVAADVLKALDLDRTSLERVDADEKGVDSIHTLGGVQSMAVINEPGLYNLVLGSRKPEAKPFKRWITHEVLPAIARTGSYKDTAHRMGETLSGATSGGIDIPGLVEDRPAFVSDLKPLIDAVTKMAKLAADRDGMYCRLLREAKREHARTIGQIVRLQKAQKPSNKDADPNRPLDEEDVEKFKYLISTGHTLKQVSRKLNRTYDAIKRFVDENGQIVQAALQRQLL